jgi:RNA recognition motif-containing protein
VFIENIPKLGNLKLEIKKVIEIYDPFSIFVNNIDKNTKDIDLINYFEIYGNIKSLRIIKTKKK